MLCGAVEAPPAGKLVYGLLLESAGTEGVRLSARQMGRVLGLSESAVRANVKRLKERGRVVVAPQYHPDGGCAANLYQVR